MQNPFDSFDENRPEPNPFDSFDYGDLTTREAVEMLPSFLTRTPFEKHNDWYRGRGMELKELGLRGTRGESAAIGAYDGLSMGNYATERSSKALYPTYAHMPFLAQGAAALDKQGLLPDWAGGGNADDQEQYLRGFQRQQTAAREENPYSYMGGEIGGYLAPGGGVLNIGSKMARTAGGKLISANLVPKGQGLLSKSGRYLGGVVAPTSVAGGFDYGLYKATVGESSDAAAEERSPTLADRVDGFKEGATSWEGYTFGALASPAYRLGRGAVTTAKNTLDASLDAGKFALKGGSFTPTPRAEWAAGLQNPSDPRSRAYRMVAKRLKADGITPEQLNKAIDNYYYAGYSSVDEMLFELAEKATHGKGGGQIKNLAVALGAVGGDAQQKAREAFRIRREMMPEKFQGSLQRAAGLTGKGETAKEFYDVLDDFAEKQIAAPQPLYEAAYANQVSDHLFVSKVLPELSTARETGILAEAADYARGVARSGDELAVARRIGGELAQLDDDLGKLADGTISAAQVRKPSTQALDYIERMFADQGRGIRKGTGRTELARGAEGASARLRQGIDGTGLGKAREMSARYKTAQEAMEFGRKAVSKSTDLETLQRELAKHMARLDPDAPPDSPTVRAALLMGYIRGADDIIMKSDTPATAIRQLYGSQRQREKMVAMLTNLDEETKAILSTGEKSDATKRLRALVGGTREDKLYHPGEFERARSQLNSENLIVGNSQTGQRNEAVAAQGGMERLLRQGYSIAKNPGKVVDDVVDLAIARVSKPGIFKPEVNRELGDIMFQGGRDDLKRIVGDLELLLSAPKSSPKGPSATGGAGSGAAAAAMQQPQKKAAQNSMLHFLLPSDRTELATTGVGAIAGGTAGLEDYNQDGSVDWKDALLTSEGRGGIVAGAGAGLIGGKVGKVYKRGLDSSVRRSVGQQVSLPRESKIPYKRLATEADFEQGARRAKLPASFDTASPDASDAILLQAVIDDLIDQGLNPKPLLRELGHLKGTSNGILGNQRGAIDFDDPDLNRRAQRMAREMGKATQAAKKRRLQQAHMEQIGENVRAQEPAVVNSVPEVPVSRPNPLNSPLGVFLGIGGVGTGLLTIDRLNRSKATTELPRKREPNPFVEGIMRNAHTALDDIVARRNQGLPKTPNLKPRRQIERISEAAKENAIQEAIRAENARSQEYWRWLGQYGQKGDRVLWNKIKRNRANELKVTPEERRNGIRDKRLPYGYEIPIGMLENAPIEVMLDGEWISEDALLAPKRELVSTQQ